MGSVTLRDSCVTQDGCFLLCRTHTPSHPTSLPPPLQTLCEGDRFDRMIRRAFQTCDELMFKVGIRCTPIWPHDYSIGCGLCTVSVGFAAPSRRATCSCSRRGRVG